MRWLQCHRDDGVGVAVACPHGHHWAMANVSPWSMQQLDAAKHDAALRDSHAVHVVVDAAHMGLGGDDSWSPAVHKVRLPCMSLLRRVMEQPMGWMLGALCVCVCTDTQAHVLHRSTWCHLPGTLWAWPCALWFQGIDTERTTTRCSLLSGSGMQGLGVHTRRRRETMYMRGCLAMCCMCYCTDQ